MRLAYIHPLPLTLAYRTHRGVLLKLSKIDRALKVAHCFAGVYRLGKPKLFAVMKRSGLSKV